MPLGPVGLDRQRDRTPELELERMRSERAGVLKNRASAIERIQENPRHRKATKERMIARLEAVWKERDKLMASKISQWYDVVCEVCHRPFRTPRPPRAHRQVRCAPCQREIRLAQKRATNNKYYHKYRAQSIASGVRQRGVAKYRRSQQALARLEADARRQFVLQFGVIAGNVTVLPMEPPIGARWPAPATKATEAVFDAGLPAPGPRSPGQVVWEMSQPHVQEPG